MNESALKDRLKNIAKEKSISFNEIWKQFLLERFLARLSGSAHQDKFIFKGGLLLAQYLIIGRETTDADFLLQKIKGEAKNIEAAIKEIIEEEPEDPTLFTWSRIEELSQPHMAYPGFRVTLDVSLGKMKDKIHIDIGVGDTVEPKSANFRVFEYKGSPLFAGEISLLIYPVETIFAEKLETIISKGSTNSRMKDYHDVLLIIREKGLLNPAKAKKSIMATFENRSTSQKFPIRFNSDGMKELQKLWAHHLKGLGSRKIKLGLPDQIESIILEINEWLDTNI